MSLRISGENRGTQIFDGLEDLFELNDHLKGMQHSCTYSFSACQRFWTIGPACRPSPCGPNFEVR